MSIRAKIDSHELRKGRLHQRGYKDMAMVLGVLEEAPVLIDDTPSLSLLQLRAKARRAKLQHDIKVVMVDYLQLLTAPRAARESRQVEVSEISRSLKALARELNVPVLAAAQLNRGPEGRTSSKPLMSDLRESGSLEQDADVVMLLHRYDYQKTPQELKAEDEGRTDLIVAKQRNGPTGVARLRFQKKYGLFAPEAKYIVDDDVPFAREQ